MRGRAARGEAQTARDAARPRPFHRSTRARLICSYQDPTTSTRHCKPPPGGVAIHLVRDVWIAAALRTLR